MEWIARLGRISDSGEGKKLGVAKVWAGSNIGIKLDMRLSQMQDADQLGPAS
jgi:hypothetical protein